MSDIQVINDNNGEVLYKGRANSQREFIESLIEQEKTFVNADLRDVDLSELNLSGLDFSHANMDSANLFRTDCKGASFKEAILNNADLSSSNLDGASLQSAEIINSNMTSIKAHRAQFRGATLHKTNLNNARLVDSVLTYTNIKRSDLSKADLTNADFGGAEIIKSDFSGADLRSRDIVDLEHQADRTRNAVIIGCRYNSDTLMERKVTEAFRKDRLQTQINHNAFAATTSLMTIGAFHALDKATQMVDPSLLNSIKDPMSLTGVTAIMGIGVFLIAKDKVQDGLKGYIGEAFNEMSRNVRRIAESMDLTAKNLKNYVVAWADEKTLNPIKRALAATLDRNTVRINYNDFGYAVSKNVGAFIVCNKNRLAEALAAISSNRVRGYKLPKEIILSRHVEESDDISAPSVIRFHKNGQTTMVWADENREPKDVVLYGDDGDPLAHIDAQTGIGTTDVSHIPNSSDIHTAINSFEKRILRESNVHDFEYPKDTHYVHAGKDGSIIVRRIEDRKLDNPLGPALVTKDKKIYAHNGEVHKESLFTKDISAKENKGALNILSKLLDSKQDHSVHNKMDPDNLESLETPIMST